MSIRVPANSARHVAIAIAASVVCSSFADRAAAAVDFAKDIQPILRERCVECHGPAQQMNGLRLDRRRDVLPNRVGANGAPVVPGIAPRVACISGSAERARDNRCLRPVR